MIDLEIGKKYVPRAINEVIYVKIDAVDHFFCTARGHAVYTDGSVAEWIGNYHGRILTIFGGDNPWDLVAEYDDSATSRSCWHGHALVDTGMRWSFCRNCETSFEFKDWIWQEAHK